MSIFSIVSKLNFFTDLKIGNYKNANVTKVDSLIKELTSFPIMFYLTFKRFITLSMLIFKLYNKFEYSTAYDKMLSTTSDFLCLFDIFRNTPDLLQTAHLFKNFEQHHITNRFTEST